MTGVVLNTNPGFESGTTAWAATSANVGIAVDRYNVPEGVYCLRCTTVAAGTDGVVQAAANRTAVTAAATYLLSGWVKSEVAATDMRLAVNWYNAGGGLISTTTPTAITTQANVWAWYYAEVTAPALATSAAIFSRNVHAGVSRAWYDNLRIVATASYSGDPQILTVEQVPTNASFGVTGKVIPIGSRIQVVDAMRVGWGEST
jgi:hypothetical protein